MQDSPPTPPDDLTAWRKSERERLIAARQAIPVAARQAADVALSDRLDALLKGGIRGRTISLYWPFRGEPDLRAWAARCRADGATLALPVVVAKAHPLDFRRWDAGVTLERGVWNIPIPPESAPVVAPDIVLAPVVGLADGHYRLGYGGGYYDRTIARLRDQGHTPLVVGVGYDQQRIATMFPQSHDIPMDKVVLVEV